MLCAEELLDLEERIKPELDDRLSELLANLNLAGKLEEFLKLLGLDKLLQQESGYQVYKTGKIVVLGESSVKSKVLLAIAKDLGLDKDRFELCLDYDAAKRYDTRKMQWKANYSLVMAGPMPHSGHGKGDSSSIIAEMENEDGYPPVVRLEAGNNGLKITKTNFREALLCVKEKGLIMYYILPKS